MTTIIPTIGRDTLWTRALPSVYAQSGDWECIVVGDGIQVIVDHPRVRCLAVEKVEDPDPLRAWRHGGVDAFNAGLAAATGEWVSYLGDDDAYRPNHHAVLAGHDADVVYGQSQAYRPDGTLLPGRLFGDRYPLEPHDVVQGSYVIRREATRPATKPLDRSWDSAWWHDILERHLSIDWVRDVVHDYFPAPENAHHHGASTW